MPTRDAGGEGGDRRHRSALTGRPWPERGPALRRMFEQISRKYDRLNTLLSLGLDRGWRDWAVRRLEGAPAGPWCDLASGTGDLGLRMLGSAPRVLRADLSPALLRHAAGKSRRLERDSPAVACEMDLLPFATASLAAVGQGFALRHCRSFESFFGELYRVLRPGGRIALLDMRYPADGPFGPLYRVYFRRALPRLAALFGGDIEAYRMMVESVRALPPETAVLAAATAAGFTEVRSERGLFGAVRLIVAIKPLGPR